MRICLTGRHLDLRMAVGDDNGGQAARSQGKHELLHTYGVPCMLCTLV